jgi:hypothetical protein
MKKMAFKAATLLLPIFFLAGYSWAGNFSMVHVNAPSINCKFDPSCKVVVSDFVTHFAWSGSASDAFLQSRLFPRGKSGTAAAGLYAYLYRIDLSKAMATVGYRCVSSFSIPFGPVKSVDYNGDGTSEQVFVITSGGLGSISPVTAVESGNNVTFTFQSPFCDGGQPGKGGMSFFFGMTSKNSSRTVTSTLSASYGTALSLQAKAPKLTLYKIKVPKLPLMKKTTEVH